MTVTSDAARNRAAQSSTTVPFDLQAWPGYFWPGPPHCY